MSRHRGELTLIHDVLAALRDGPLNTRTLKRRANISAATFTNTLKHLKRTHNVKEHIEPKQGLHTKNRIHVQSIIDLGLRPNPRVINRVFTITHQGRDLYRVLHQAKEMLREKQ